MFRKLKGLFLLVLPALWNACAPIHEDLDRCEVYLEFVYDYNLEYTDSFTAQVETVDVFVFDAEGKYLFAKHAETATGLIDGKRMSLAGDLDFGTYKILTVGGLTDSFRVADGAGSPFIPGATTLEEATISLRRGSDKYGDRFASLWYGRIVEIEYTPAMIEHKTWRVHLIKDTNVFNLVLYRRNNTADEPVFELLPPYTFEIVTPEGAVYGHDNEPKVPETVTYTPYSLTAGTASNSYAVGSINTVRLMHDYRPGQTDGSGYRLIVRNRRTLKEAWNVDLLELLAELNSDLHGFDDMQEFLDRKSVWDIAILHNGGGPDEEHDAFLGVAIQIDPWIKWYHDAPLG